MRLCIDISGKVVNFVRSENFLAIRIEDLASLESTKDKESRSLLFHIVRKTVELSEESFSDAQEEDFLPVQEEGFILPQEALLPAQEGDLLLAQREDLLLAQALLLAHEDDLLLAQEE